MDGNTEDTTYTLEELMRSGKISEETTEHFKQEKVLKTLERY